MRVVEVERMRQRAVQEGRAGRACSARRRRTRRNCRPPCPSRGPRPGTMAVLSASCRARTMLPTRSSTRKRARFTTSGGSRSRLMSAVNCARSAVMPIGIGSSSVAATLAQTRTRRQGCRGTGRGRSSQRSPIRSPVGDTVSTAHETRPKGVMSGTDAEGSPPRADHRLRDAGEADADAGLHHRQRRAAVHAGQHVGHARRDHLGADLLRDRRRDHDRAGRLDGGALRPQEAVHRLHDRLHRSPPCCAARRSRWSRWSCFRLLQGMCGAALVPLSQATMLDIYPFEPPRPGDGDLRHGRDDGADHGADARRLSDRHVQLALGVLRQPAVRHPRDHRPAALHAEDAAAAGAALRLVPASPCWRSASARCR